MGNVNSEKHLLCFRKSKGQIIAPAQQEGDYMAKITPMKAIRQKCLDCCCGSAKEVRLCGIKKCPLYVYRNGHRPKDEEFTIEED